MTRAPLAAIPTPIRILNLGAGLQSSVVLLMSERGELPRVDMAIFADTGWEPPAVYEHLEWLKGQTSIPIHVVSKGNIRQDCIDRQNDLVQRQSRFSSMPFYSPSLDKIGKTNIMRRQCTTEYKIEVIDRFVRRNVLNLESGKHAPKTPVVERWFGISVDEMQRMRDSRVKWATHEYPLCGYPTTMFLARRTMSRWDCQLWAEKHYPERKFPRSACIGCPFHSDYEWRQIRQDPDLWEDACSFDEAIRHAEEFVGEVYLHRSCVPLREAYIEDDVPGQISLLDECLGMCGV